MIKIVDQTIDYTSVSQMSYVKNWQSPSNNVCSAEKYAKRCTEVRFASFLSGAFITAIVVNSPERKLAIQMLFSKQNLNRNTGNWF